MILLCLQFLLSHPKLSAELFTIINIMSLRLKPSILTPFKQQRSLTATGMAARTSVYADTNILIILKQSTMNTVNS